MSYQPFKNYQYRIIFWVGLIMALIIINPTLSIIKLILIMSIAILIDEFIKEGYFIKESDFKKPFTHEFILLLISLVGIVLTAIRRLKKNDEK